MKINLHKNARTTPAQRAFIQSNIQMNVSDLAIKIGVSETTIRRWKKRNFVFDKSHTPKHVKTSLAPINELLTILLRTSLRLSLDDLHQVITRFVFPECSRSGLNRCLKRYGLSRLNSLQKQIPFQLNDYQGTYLLYSKIDFPGFKSSKEAFTIQTLIDCSFRYIIADISPFCARNDLFFINRIVRLYPLSVLGIIFPQPVVLFDKNSGIGETASRHEEIIQSYCSLNNLDSYSLGPMINSSTLETLKKTWATFGKKKHRFFMNQLETENEEIQRNLRTYNTSLQLRTLHGQTPVQALKNHYKNFPGSFRQNPEIIF